MKRCGLLGRKLGHSYSPAIHARFGGYEYRLYEREPEEVESFLREGPWDGLNVTIPYKKTAAARCTALSPLARTLGNVNTLIRRPDGSVYGDNTDAWGFLQTVRRLGVDCAGKEALVLGSGGASATAQAVLRRLGARVTVVSRSGPDNYDNLDRHRDAAILVNATPVGMYPDNDSSPLSLSRLPGLEAVLDLIYNPARTRLLLEAEERGIPHAGGLYMLTAQAARASQLFTGTAIPEETLEEVCRQVGTSMENWILIGMPGCGKTAVGQRLARRANRPFADTDQILERQTGLSIPEYFTAYGESAFRDAETRILQELGKRSGLVIATGGGCVTRPENYPLLRQNGRIIWLQRSLELLPDQGRPLTLRDGIETLYRIRHPLYRRFADWTVSNDGTPEETVQQIWEAIAP